MSDIRYMFKCMKVEFYMMKGLLIRALLFFFLFFLGSVFAIPEIIYIWGMFIVTAILDMRYEYMDRCENRLLLKSLSVEEEHIFIAQSLLNIMFTLVSIIFAIIVYNISMYFDLYVFSIDIYSYFGKPIDFIVLISCISCLFSMLETFIFIDNSYNRACLYQIALLIILSMAIYGLYNIGILMKVYNYFSTKKNILMICVTCAMIFLSGCLKVIMIRKKRIIKPGNSRNEY